MLNIKTISYLLLTVNLILLIGLISGIQAFYEASSPWIPKYAAAYFASKKALVPLQQPIIAILVGCILLLQIYMTVAKNIKFLIPFSCISLYALSNFYINGIINDYPSMHYSDVLYILYSVNLGLLIIHFFFTSRYTNKYV
jgi:hypothetical protein